MSAAKRKSQPNKVDELHSTTSAITSDTTSGDNNNLIITKTTAFSDGSENVLEFDQKLISKTTTAAAKLKSINNNNFYFNSMNTPAIDLLSLPLVANATNVVDSVMDGASNATIVSTATGQKRTMDDVLKRLTNKMKSNNLQ